MEGNLPGQIQRAPCVPSMQERWTSSLQQLVQPFRCFILPLLRCSADHLTRFKCNLTNMNGTPQHPHHPLLPPRPLCRQQSTRRKRPCMCHQCNRLDLLSSCSCLGLTESAYLLLWEPPSIKSLNRDTTRVQLQYIPSPTRGAPGSRCTAMALSDVFRPQCRSPGLPTPCSCPNSQRPRNSSDLIAASMRPQCHQHMVMTDANKALRGLPRVCVLPSLGSVSNRCILAASCKSLQTMLLIAC